MTVVHREFPFRPTGAAAAAVAVEHGLTLAGKAAAGVRFAPVTAGAQSAAKQPEAAAGAEKPGLPTAQRRVARR